jgi:glutamyl-tRNA synthetase
VFDEKRLNKSPAIFDIAKLKWMNGCYIRALPFEEFHKLAEKEYDKFLTRSVNREALSKVLQPRVETLVDIAEAASFIETLPEYSEELFINKKMKTDVEIAKKSLALAIPALEGLNNWTNEGLFECLKAVAQENGLKNGQVLYPVRIALTGLETTPGGASEIAEVLGKEETLKRLKSAC